MRRQAASLWSCISPLGTTAPRRATAIDVTARRYVRIYATPDSTSPTSEELDLSFDTSSAQPDAKFEVLGAPSSLLSIQLSPSQNLYTRRGTLVAVSGKAENAVSTLSFLSPFTRAPLGIPFLYQKISSASPITALVSTRSPFTSFAVVHLDGRLDWMVAQRTALLAWSGHNLVVKPRINSRLSIQHWGNTSVTGRGLLALVGRGQIYQVSLKEGEQYVVHPSNVVAYTQNPWAPQPYRFRSTTLKLQIPSIGGLLPNSKFFIELKKSGTWKFLAETLYRIRTWTRRSVWGDRLFLQFKGPTTILLQSRGSRLGESLSSREIDEIADAPAGAVQLAAAKPGHEAAVGPNDVPDMSKPTTTTPASDSPSISYATVKHGKVEIKPST